MRKPAPVSGTAGFAERALAAKRAAEAAKIFRELAEAGDATAQLRLAQLYERGQGVLQSFVDAVHWFRAAAEQGSVPAQARLGEIYLTGLEPPATASPSAIARMPARPPGRRGQARVAPQSHCIPRPRRAPGPRAGRGVECGRRQGGRMPTRRRGSATSTRVASVLVRDLADAEQWFAAAAAQNHVAGQLGLGMLYAGQLR